MSPSGALYEALTEIKIIEVIYTICKKVEACFNSINYKYQTTTGICLKNLISFLHMLIEAVHKTEPTSNLSETLMNMKQDANVPCALKGSDVT